ncbi:MAG: beta strand repeat-containing protein, partial [Isosphaerales bacterium]
LAGATFTVVDFYGGAGIGGDGTGAFNNAGALISSAHGAAIGDAFTNTGTVTVQQGSLGLGNATNSGTVTVAPGATLGVLGYTQTAGATFLKGGTINGGSLSINAGALSGSGTINANVTNGGQVIPGGTGSVGLLTINGNYTQTASGSLNVELGGTTAGSSDQLAVSGPASLDGTLNVSLINNFQPAVGNTFQVLSFGNSSGNFGTDNGLNLGGGLFLDPVFNAKVLTLDTDQVAISGAPALPVEGIPITLTGSVTGPSSGNTFNFAWTVTQNGNSYASGSGSTYTFTPNVNATYVIGLTVTDASGGQGTASVQVIVGPSIFVLNSSAGGALTLSGNAAINIPGKVVVDSSSSSALSASGNAQISASVIDVQGGFKKTGNATFSPAPTTGVSVPDPLAGLMPPSASGTTMSVNLTKGSLTIQPGIYSQITVSGNAKLTLGSGTYIIEGGGLTVTGSASISGTNVFIYNAGGNYPSSGGNFGGITLSGNGTFNLSAPITGPYAGILIFQSCQNTRALSFSGNAMLGMSGTIYAPNALLSLSGNSQLQSSLDVGMLNLNGNVALTQTAAGSDGTGDTSGIANTLLAGNLSLYINDPNGYLTSDELARIQDAINAWDAILAPYDVTITEVNDPSLANVVLDTSTTSACGGVAAGVLGCYNVANSEITLVQGWNWYAGSDPTQIGAGQYDFETTVLHELGHALGLGGSTDPSSPMYETLAPGVADRTVTTQDLNIPDPPEGADPQSAAGFNFGAAIGSFAQNGYTPTIRAGPSTGPVGLMPLPAAGIAGTSVSTGLMSQTASSVAQPAVISQAGPQGSLVVQGLDRESRDGRIPWITPIATDLMPWPNVPRQPAGPTAEPVVDDQTGSEHSAVAHGTDWGNEDGFIPTKSRTGLVPDSVLDELASDPEVRGARCGVRGVPGTIGALALARAGVADPTIPTCPMPRQDPPRQSATPKASLTDILLAAGLCSLGAGTLAARRRQAGSRPHWKKWSVVSVRKRESRLMKSRP